MHDVCLHRILPELSNGFAQGSWTTSSTPNKRIGCNRIQTGGASCFRPVSRWRM